MTRDETIRAFSMRYDGYSYSEIASELNYTKQHICNTLYSVCRRSMSLRFQNLYTLIIAEYGSLAHFASEKELSVGTVHRFFHSDTYPSKKVILAAIQSFPEKSYSELFSDDELKEDC